MIWYLISYLVREYATWRTGVILQLVNVCKIIYRAPMCYIEIKYQWFSNKIYSNNMTYMYPFSSAAVLAVTKTSSVSITVLFALLCPCSISRVKYSYILCSVKSDSHSVKSDSYYSLYGIRYVRLSCRMTTATAADWLITAAEWLCYDFLHLLHFMTQKRSVFKINSVNI